MHFLWFLIIGIVAGFLAGKITKGSGFGLIMDLVLGVGGAFLGGWLFGLLNIHLGGSFGALIIATAGAIVLIWITSFFSKK